MEKQNKKIDLNSTLKEILSHKKAREILFKHGVPCLSCPMMANEMNELTIGHICDAYGIDIDKLLDDLNDSRIN